MKKIVPILVFCFFILNLGLLEANEYVNSNLNSNFTVESILSRDFDIYNELAFYPYYLGLALWMSDWHTYGLEMYDWDEDWIESMEWEFRYSGELIDVILMNIEEMNQIINFTIIEDHYAEMLAQVDIMGSLTDILFVEYDYFGIQLYSYESHVSDFMGGWVNSERGTYTYSGDLMTEYLIEIWDETEQQWQEDRLQLITYSGDKIIEIVEQQWSDGWINYSKTVKTWQGDLLAEAYIYEWSDGEWVYDYHQSFEFSGDEISYALLEDWDGSQWINEYKDFYTYYSDNLVEEIFGQEWDGDSWINDMKTVYIYSNEVDPQQIPPVELRLTNYPNPFNPETIISLHTEYPGQEVEISIYNPKGQLVKSLETNKEEICWNGTDNAGNNLPSGIYLCKAETTSQTVTTKLVMLK